MVEILEKRRLLAVTYGLSGSTLTLNDDASSHDVLIAWSSTTVQFYYQVDGGTAVSMYSSPGDPILATEVSKIVMNGNDGNDDLHAAFPTTGKLFEMNGGNGNDTLVGGSQNDTLAGNAGSDYLGGQQGDDILVGGTGNDSVNGADGADTLYASGNGDGQDTLMGDNGIDTIDYQSKTNAVTVGLYINGNDGEVGENDDVFGEVILSGSGNDRIDARVDGNPQPYPTRNVNFAVTLAGANGNDTLFGSSSAGDLLGGGGGNDSLNAIDSNVDTLDGGSGTDSVTADASDVLISIP